MIIRVEQNICRKKGRTGEGNEMAVTTMKTFTFTSYSWIDELAASLSMMSGSSHL